ncbi:caspase family protein [Streptomyces sp. NPDC048550]|uniref:caspase family protein n=1 Tax=unclassified Streptomyces TaxID=2593676 RepID=UPI000A4A2C9E|nr:MULTISPECIES: caspase family protein [unclassified Streptomyces]MCX5149480.1 caspase family protein [Streptomyces sp. NBC_00320]WSN52525.1 caspase family protein [Streptomyces sp. NBC_01296]
MPAGVSIHVGLNNVDPRKYDGWDGQLMACENDARDMAELARGAGFDDTVILTKEATVDTVTAALRKAAGKLGDGDILLLTYSGHGGQMPDSEGDEPDELDETLVFFDRQFLDDELHREFQRFHKDVRIITFLDCCHSGTATELIDTPAPGDAVRLMPVLKQQQIFERDKAFFQGLQRELRGTNGNGGEPGVVLISACQDDQVALDGSVNGKFTETLLKVWNGGDFSGDYETFHRDIKKRMPRTQIPNFFTTGSPDTQFLGQKPFTI